MSSKLTPIKPPFSPEIAGVLENYPKNNGYLLRLFRVFANSLRFLSKGVPNLLDDGSPLSVREREIIILRVTSNSQCEYEWGVHVAVFAKEAKLGRAEVKAIRAVTNLDDVWSKKEQILINIIDQLMDKGFLLNSTLAEFRKNWSHEQQLEVCALCGTYQTVSYVANIAEVDNEKFAARFVDY